jgi:hypothetical protein
MTETVVTSFVIRFTQDQENAAVAPWRGLVRHVQSNQESHFTQIEEALNFMADFVDLSLDGFPQNIKQNWQASADE